MEIFVLHRTAGSMTLFDVQTNAGCLSMPQTFQADAAFLLLIFMVVPVDQNAKGHDGLAANHEWPMLDLRDGNMSLEHLLLELETIQSRVVKLKTQLNKTVYRKTAHGSASSIAQWDLVSCSGQSPSLSPGHNGDSHPIGALNTSPNYLSECETEDLVVSESAISSFGDAAANISESTVSLLPLDQKHIGIVCYDVKFFSETFTQFSLII